MTMILSIKPAYNVRSLLQQSIRSTSRDHNTISHTTRYNNVSLGSMRYSNNNHSTIRQHSFRFVSTTVSSTWQDHRDQQQISRREQLQLLFSTNKKTTNTVDDGDISHYNTKLRNIGISAHIDRYVLRPSS